MEILRDKKIEKAYNFQGKEIPSHFYIECYCYEFYDRDRHLNSYYIRRKGNEILSHLDSQSFQFKKVSMQDFDNYLRFLRTKNTFYLNRITDEKSK